MPIERCVIKDSEGNIIRIIEKEEAQKIFWENADKLDDHSFVVKNLERRNQIKEEIRNGKKS